MNNEQVKKNLRGATLMEVLVAMAISALMLTGVFAMIAPSNRMYHKTSVLQRQRQICRTINTGINERLRFATDVVIIKTPPIIRHVLQINIRIIQLYV